MLNKSSFPTLVWPQTFITYKCSNEDTKNHSRFHQPPGVEWPVRMRGRVPEVSLVPGPVRSDTGTEWTGHERPKRWIHTM